MRIPEYADHPEGGVRVTDDQQWGERIVILLTSYTYSSDSNEITPSKLLSSNIKFKEKFCAMSVHSFHKVHCYDRCNQTLS
jgi:hypothetical protein